MRHRLFILVIVFCLTTAMASAIAWFWTLPARQITLPDFLKTGERIGRSPGYFYLNVSPQPDAATLATIQKMEQLSKPLKAVGLMPNSSRFAGRSSGDRWIFVGWREESQTNTLGPYKAVVDLRVGYWISPWIGLLPLALLILHLLAFELIWRLRVRMIEKRFRAGACHVCGYDLRATADRCPECGTAVLFPPPSAFK